MNKNYHGEEKKTGWRNKKKVKNGECTCFWYEYKL